jgi:hypothetical protein
MPTFALVTPGGTLLGPFELDDEETHDSKADLSGPASEA